MSHLYTHEGPAPLDGRKVMLATTSYQAPDASYTHAIAASREALHQAGIPSAYALLEGNCHVDDARNSIVRHFLDSDCSDLVFLDADVSWRADDLVKLCQYPHVHIVGAVYPYRRPDKRDDMPCRMLPDGERRHDGLLEMDGLPTGFMRITRWTLQNLANTAKAYRITGDPGKLLPIVFERLEIEDGRRSGDLSMCWKVRQAGGRIWCDPEIRLGHVAKSVLYDSLGASLRRKDGSTLKYVCDRIRAGTETPNDFHEAIEAAGNTWWSACATVLASAVALARQGGWHVIEAGSGLSTVLMAAALPRGAYVYAMEHDPLYAAQLIRTARQAGVSNIGLIEGMCQGWYDLEGSELPSRFGLGFVDGPPRQFGTRMRFFEVFGDMCDVIVADDADDAAYAEKIVEWTQESGASLDYMAGRVAIMRPKRKVVEAAAA